jgi:hypothetical protein
MKEEMKEIATGVFQKNEKTFFIKCSLSQKLCYCSKDRLDILSKKYGGLERVSEHYVSRDAKRLKKAGITNKSLEKMDPDDVIEEARNLHKEKKKKKEERKQHRELVEQREELAAVIEPHVDPRLHPYNPEALEKITREKGCLRMKYRNQEGKCNECMYRNGCEAAIKECFGEFFAPKGYGGEAVKACHDFFKKQNKQLAKLQKG